MKFKPLIALLAAIALAAPATAGAHVTLQPEEAEAGSYTVLDVRVPNERDSANTTKVDVRFPPGFVQASYQQVPGWTTKVVKEKLAKPIQTDDGRVTEGIREIVWSGGRLPPGQFIDFPLSVQIPGKPGDTLTFKALQTYDNGEVVRWIGPPSADEPAPRVSVTGEGEAATAASAAASDSDSASKGLGVVALIVGALGLLAGGAALIRSRRTG